MAGSHHRLPAYRRRAKLVVAAADTDPATRCWRCDRTKAEHGRPWHAGHLRDGDPASPLAAECEQCNTSAGARLGNERRARLRNPTSRSW